jgi:predicted MFS family arabinose efflux permease
VRIPRSRNLSLWLFGCLVSNVGTWMQRTAQDWLVLTRLTHHSGTAVGVTVGLQFVPLLLFSPYVGALVDRLPRRLLIGVAQAIMGAGALALAVLDLSGSVALWEVWVCAFGVGIGSALDNPARQALIPEIVPRDGVAGAIAMMSAAQNIARMMGPALAGALVAGGGTGPVFALNAASCVVLLLSVAAMRAGELHRIERHARPGTAREGLAYVAGRPDLIVILGATGLISTFTLNNALNIAMMATTHFHRGAGAYGLLSTILALGGVSGAFIRGRARSPGLRLIGVGAFLLGVTLALNAVMPAYGLYALSLFPSGIAMTLFLNWSNVAVQLATAPAMRGRVFALYTAILMGATPIGSPLIGWIGSTFGAPQAMLTGATAAIAAAALSVGVATLRPSVASLHLRAVDRYDDVVEIEPFVPELADAPGAPSLVAVSAAQHASKRTNSTNEIDLGVSR